MQLSPLLGGSWNKILLEDSDKSRNKVEEYVKITLAGEVAEALLVGKGNWHGAKHNLENCYMLCGSYCGSMDEIDAYLKWLWLSVQNALKLPFNWVCVEAVAEALMEHGRIGYTKARAIIDEARKKSPRRLPKGT